MIRHWLVAGVAVVTAMASFAMFYAKFRPQSREDALAGQSNTKIVFYGLAVDQDGRPLDGATITYRIEAYPKDWTFDTRGRENDASEIAFVSGSDGKFSGEVYGCTLRRLKAQREGYRHFAEDAVPGSELNASTYFYRLIAWSEVVFKSDPEHPAVFVFVKDGNTGVSALPCRGGFGRGPGAAWILNKPDWPEKPSLKDVTRKSSSGAATTRSTLN